MTNSTYFSIRDHTFDDSINQYTTPSYNDVTNIEVTLNGTVLTTPTDYSIGGTTLTFTSSLMSSASDGDAIRIRRKTNPQTRSVNFEDGSVLKADTLDLDSNELFYMAQEAKDAAESAVADYNARYYGSLKVAPTSPAPSIGDLWYDTTNNVMKVYASAGWQQSTSAVGVTHTERVVYTVGTASGNYAGSSTSTFPVTYDSGYVDVYLNGVKQVLGSDFTASDGATVVLTPAASSGDLLDIVAYGETSLESELREDVNGKLDKAGGTLTGNLNLGSTKKINIGDNNDLQLYHNGTSSFIHEVGDGFLGILGADIIIANSDASKNYLTATANASLSLYYDGNPRLNTTSDGIGVTGTISATGYNDSDWNTAYGWGDHAQAGYLTSYTETDPVFSAHAASGVTATKISNWDTAYDNHITGVNYSGSTLTLTQQDGGTLTTTINASGGNGGDFGDNEKATFGASDDLEIYHDSSNNHSYIAETNESGSLFIKGTHIYLQNSTGQDALNLINGDAYIKSGGNTKLQTTANGIDVTGNIDLPDNGKLLLGASDDLQIWHDGSNSRIKDSGTGDLFIQGSTNVQIEDASGANMIFATSGGSVKLFHNALPKLETKSTGIDVTGTATMDGLTVESGAGNIGIVTKSTDQFAFIGFEDNTSSTSSVYVGADGNDFIARANSLTRFRAASNGDISFYEDTGTTPKFFWDASAERLGIGTASPDAKLTIGDGTGITGMNIKASASTLAYIDFGDPDDTNIGGINWDNATDTLGLRAGNSNRLTVGATGDITQTGGDYIYSGGGNWDLKHTTASQNIVFSTTPTGGSATERLRIKSDGKVGIGTSSPATALDVTGTVTADGLTVDASSTGRATLGTFSNTTNAGGTEAAISLRNSATGDCDVSLVANRTGANHGSDFYIETSQSSGGDNKKRFNIAEDGDISFYEDTGTTPKFYWDASAESLGIGTTSPSTALEVIGDIKIKQGSEYSNYALIDASEAQLTLETYSNNTTAHPADIIFKPAGSERMRITDSGNLLVGTTDASVYNNNSNSTADNGFNVSSTGQFYGAKSGASVGILNRTSSDGSILEFRKSGATVGSISTKGDDLTIQSSASNHKGLRFGDSYIAPTDNNGNIQDATTSLGTSSNRFKDLHLSGTVNADKVDLGINSVITNTGYTTPSITMKSYSDTASGQSTHISFTMPNGTQKGKITSSIYSTTYSTSSDYRLKEDIQDVSDATSRTLALNPCNFQWIGTSERVDGFIAHELADIVPEAVVGEKDAVDENGNPDYQGIDQAKLVPLLVKTIQELEARIATLENK